MASTKIDTTGAAWSPVPSWQIATSASALRCGRGARTPSGNVGELVGSFAQRVGNHLGLQRHRGARGDATRTGPSWVAPSGTARHAPLARPHGSSAAGRLLCAVTQQHPSRRSQGGRRVRSQRTHTAPPPPRGRRWLHPPRVRHPTQERVSSRFAVATSVLAVSGATSIRPATHSTIDAHPSAIAV